MKIFSIAIRCFPHWVEPIAGLHLLSLGMICICTLVFMIHCGGNWYWEVTCYVIELIIALSFRRRVGFTDGTLRRKKSGRSIMNRKKLCPRLHFSLGLRCRMDGKQGSKTRTRNSPTSSTRSTRYLPVRRLRRVSPLVVVMAVTLMTKSSPVRSFACEATLIEGRLAVESLHLGNLDCCILSTPENRYLPCCINSQAEIKF